MTRVITCDFETCPCGIFVRGGPSTFLSDKGSERPRIPYIGSNPTFFYFDLYFNIAYTQHITFIARQSL